jgi:hypothetical protein
MLYTRHTAYLTNVVTSLHLTVERSQTQGAICGSHGGNFTVFWDVTSCSRVEVRGRFCRTYSLFSESKINQTSTQVAGRVASFLIRCSVHSTAPQTETLRSLETLNFYCQTTWRHNDDGILQRRHFSCIQESGISEMYHYERIGFVSPCKGIADNYLKK